MHSAFSHGSGAGVTIDDRSNAAARRGEFVRGVSSAMDVCRVLPLTHHRLG